MKLAKVEHRRCSEWTHTSYVWVPDEMTQGEFDAICDKARDAYLAAEREWKNDPKSPPYVSSSPDYGRYPDDMTIAQVRAEHKLKKEAYDAWEKKKRHAQKYFFQYLTEVSEVIKRFYDGDFAFTSHVDWGHNHGMDIAYDDKKTLPLKQELRGAADEQEEDDDE
jgi:hypothetical protein